MTHQEKIEAIRQKAIEENPEIKEEGPCPRFGGNHHCGSCEQFIGRPIRLADVALTLIGAPLTTTAFQRATHLLVVNWEHVQDDLSEQSEETITLLYDLLNSPDQKPTKT